MTDNLVSPVSVSLSKAGATGYTVRDYHGTIVSSGVLSGSATSVIPTPPVAGWAAGWYRIYLTGPNTDAVYGSSYGAANFVVIRDNAHFLTNPAGHVAQFGVDPGYGQGGGEFKDLVMKGIMFRGTSRHQIGDVTNPTSSSDSIATAQTAIPVGWRFFPDTDAARPAYQFMQFPNGTIDKVVLVSGTQEYLRCYVKDPTVDGTKVFVASGAGSSSGTKVTVYYPNASTLVETYDNLGNSLAAETAINTTTPSNYIRAFHKGGTSAGTAAATAIGDSFRAGTAALVAQFYAAPYNIVRYEGPSNEPGMNPEIAHRMRLFQAAVHLGNASAKAIGPCNVDILNIAAWDSFFAAGGGSYCDEISTHAYNFATNGDLNLGRSTIEAWMALLASYGLTQKIWITESTSVFNAVYGVHHPRRSRVPVLQTLLWEQYGVPREQNLVWYDRSHGFWPYPAFIAASGESLVPFAVLYRVLAEETFGQAHHHRVDFASEAANRIFLGSVYKAANDTGTAVLLTTSYVPSSSVALTMLGASNGDSITTVDGLGVESSLTVASGRITVPVSDIPTYVRLPAGVNVSVYSVNDWGHTPHPSVSSQATIRTLGGTATSGIGDDQFMSSYSPTVGIYTSTASLPDSAVLQFGQSVTVDRVIVFCGPCWQPYATLLDYDIDTWDGAAWTTQVTVTKTTPSSFSFGSDSTDMGCTRETYWDEQWIEDVKLPSPVACQGVRVHVRSLSYGGEPDAAAVAAGGQGTATPKLALQEVMVISGSSFSFPTDYATDVLADSPNVYLRLDESSGTFVSQVNSPTADGTAVSGVTRSAAGAIGDGNAGITVTSGSLTVADNTLTKLGNGPLTVEIWVNTSSVSSTFTVVDKGDNGYALTVRGGGQIGLTKSGHGLVSVSTNDTAGKITASAWHHLVATKNGSSMTLYKDGVDVTGTLTDQTLNNTSGLPLSIGSTPLASLDEFALYPTVLSAARVLSHYQSGISSRPSVNLTVPVITGTATVGKQLQASQGTWTGTIPTAFTYQWKRDGSSITGATRSDYVIVSADLGHALTVSVSATNAAGSSSAATSTSTGTVT